MELYSKELSSPIGRLTAVISDAGLCRLVFPDEGDLEADLKRRFGEATLRRGTPPGYHRALRAYFRGDLRARRSPWMRGQVPAQRCGALRRIATEGR
jgi:hypothetical protein